jgi:acyl-CoA synthetase (NDP forming)
MWVVRAGLEDPAARELSIVSSGGGAGVLAADACAEAGLAIARPGREARRRLRDVLPAGSALGRPG